MKFNVPGKALYYLASSVSKVINAKNALTILNSFLFTLNDDLLVITGSDVENSLSASINVTNSTGNGQFCIDARRLVDLLKELPDQGLEFSIDDETLEVHISYSSGEYSMMATPGNQYPAYQAEEESEEPMTFTCPASVLIKGIDKTMFAIGSDDFHPQMMGILLDIVPEHITFVATDTRKLVKYVNSSVAPGITAKCILPLKPATVLKNVFPKEDDLEITLTSKSATIMGTSFSFNCRFIKGNFPPYDRVIPKNNPYALRIDRLRFLNSVRRVGVFVDPGFGLEKFRITNDRLNIKSNDTNLLTSGNETMDCEYEGPEIVIGFNAPYLIEICNVLTTDQIIVNLSDPSRPGVFRPSEDEKDSELIMLLMPMVVSEF